MRDLSTEKQEDKGNVSIRINLILLDTILADLAFHAKDYPPQFDSYKDEQRAISDVKKLSAMLEILANSSTPNPEMLFRAAYLNRIGYNLDIPGTPEKTNMLFQKLLDILPDSPQGNYQYGLFLFGATKPKEAIPYLEKAVAVGVTDAKFTLGFAYLNSGNQKKALECFEAYKLHKPYDNHTDTIINSIRNGEIEHVDTTNRIYFLKKFSSFMTYYYLKPAPEMVADAILFIDKSKMFEQEHPSITGIFGFFTIVFKQNSGFIPEWQKVIDLTSDKTKSIFYPAMRVAQKDDSILQMEGHSPSLNDMFWGAFFASGDVRYLSKIVQELEYIDERKDINLFLTGATAKWSLSANARTHKKVRDFLQSSTFNKKDRLFGIVQDLLNKEPEKIMEETRKIVKQNKGNWEMKK